VDGLKKTRDEKERDGPKTTRNIFNEKKIQNEGKERGAALFGQKGRVNAIKEGLVQANRGVMKSVAF